MTKLYFSPGMLVFITLIALAAISTSDSPPVNTIPIISMKTAQLYTSNDISLDIVCELLWHNFDGIWLGGYAYPYNQGKNLVLADSVGAIVIFAPAEFGELSVSEQQRWGRYTTVTLQDDSAYIHPTADFSSIDAVRNAVSMDSIVITRAADSLKYWIDNFDCVWYFDIMNEGSAWQLAHMLSDTSEYDDFFPSLFTQDTMMTEVLPSGLFSWIKFKSDSMYTGDFPSVSCCFSMLHSIDSLEWAGFPGMHLADSTITQANSIRAYFNTQYQEYAANAPYPAPQENFPERMDLNTYPVRMAGYTWQDDEDSITVLGSATDLWMLQHYEILMDSTFIPAGTDANGPYPINYHAQAFGRTGGRAIWQIAGDPPDTTIQYAPYSYRIPSPGEFQMLCNIGLLRGAKGVFPYSIRSYSGWKDDTLLHHDAGLLDEELIPFDAPYEDWVYRERPVGDYYYAPPDLIPPWTAADSSQFDPLYSLPDRPAPVGERATEILLNWKFAAYGRLWNSVRRTFGQITRVAPELSRLWWWYEGNRYDDASIDYDGTEPSYFAEPQIRVFTDSTKTDCYLFYVNRFCRANNNPFEIEVNHRSFPEGTPFSEYALDHSRRFLIEGDLSGTIYTYLDTLDAGEARLLQMFDESDGLEADVRITDPDLFAILPAKGDTLVDNRSPANESVDIVARFYNMGTESQANIWVFLYDETDSVKLDSTRISLDGLSTSTCWTVEREEVFFEWTPDSTDIGVHVLKAYAETWHGEPDPTDNSAHLVFIVDPRDYATEVLDDSWDMTEAVGEDWHTDDITAMVGWESTYSDSISGMFEGELSNPSAANKMQLNTGTSLGDSINTSLYQNLTIAAKSEITLDVEVHWLDTDSASHYVDLGEDITTTWTEIGPINLQDIVSSEWDDKDAISFWLEFSGVGVVPKDVRIGWIKLTE